VSTPEEVVISVRGLVSKFGPHLVHDGLNLDVRRGEVLGLVGGSGAGKSVLLNTILGLKEPDGGTIRVLDAPEALDGVARRKRLDQRIGVLFQGGALFSALNVRDNVAAPLREHTRIDLDLIDDLANLKIAMAGLAPQTGDLAPSDLSGGMRKRASLARALALDPELLFLDEPTAGLDPIGADEFDHLLLSLRQALGLTVVMATHDLDTLYATTDRIAVIADRKIVAIAPAAELERSQQPWIRKYFLGPRSRVAQRLMAEGPPHGT
jgi:phospholipid/cholesterol/gamma-HCH transport system ATP-binding protein